jgi:hypothetical protein
LFPTTDFQTLEWCRMLSAESCAIRWRT